MPPEFWSWLSDVWSFFAKSCTPFNIFLIAFIVWSKIENYLLRKRMGDVLDAKDKTIEKMTYELFSFGQTSSGFLDLLERLVEKLKK